MTESLETPGRALVVPAHPDDAEINCGGAVARWAKEGAEVYYVLCTDGGKGTDAPDMSPERLSAIREKEQQDAADVLGVKEVVMLHYPDGELEETYEFRKELVRAIRRFRPDVVLAPDPHRRMFYQHRDHRIAGQVAIDAAFPYARDRLHYLDLLEVEGLEPHKAGMVLFWGAEAPDVHVDISDVMDTKVNAYLCHRSQWSKNPDRVPVQFMKDIGRRAGEAAGVQYAEAFRAVRFRR